MRTAWPSLLVALGGLVLALVGVVEAQEAANPADALYECDRRLNCDAVAVLQGSSGSSVAAWYLPAVICFVGAALLLWARKR